MKPLTQADLWSLADYDKHREDFIAEVIAERKHRQISVGPVMDFLFENRTTVKFQTMEILRTEKISDLKGVQEELDTFNALLPGPSELSATLMIAILDLSKVDQELAKLRGLSRSVFLEVGGERVRAEFDEGREDAKRLSAVQYLRFRLSEKAKQAFLRGAETWLAVDHPAYRHKAALSEPMHKALAADLAAG